jgi:chromosomal replication initiation ATPase DnaA
VNEIELVGTMVADCFDIEYQELFTVKRFAEIETARRFMYYILNQHYNFSVTKLSEDFETTDTSIIFSLKHIAHWIKESELAKKDYFNIISKLEQL